MSATPLEFRHQRLLHLIIVGLALSTYLRDRDDVVWRFVKGSPAPHTLERFAFVVAATLTASGAAICTWARHRHKDQHLGAHPPFILFGYAGEFIYAIGLASLVPLAGFVILVAGEAVRILRLILRAHHQVKDTQEPASQLSQPPYRSAQDLKATWALAFRQEVVKWGVSVTMIVFVITLRDRYADVGVLASFLLGILLNPPATFVTSKSINVPVR